MRMSSAAMATAADGVAPLVRVDESLQQRPLLVARLAARSIPIGAPAGAPASSPGPAAARCWRRRTLVSSSAAVSLAGQPEHVARRSARPAGAAAAPAARRGTTSSIVSRSTTTASGCSSLGATSSSSASGYGCSHGTSANECDSGQPPRPAAQQVEAHVRRDAVEPCPDKRAAVERVAAAPRAQERLLHRVLGLVERGQHPVAVDVQLAPVPLGERRERGLLARDRRRRLRCSVRSSSFDRFRGYESRPDLLDEPAVAVRVAERHERAVVGALGIQARGLAGSRRSGRFRRPRCRVRPARRGRPRCR